MADSSISVTEGSGKNVDTRTNAAGDHRQVIVLGDSSVTDSVAAVQSTDPASNTQGIVVRDVNTSAIVAQLASGVAVSGSLTGITNSIAAHILSTGGTIGVFLKPGTLAVSLDPGHQLGNIGTIASITASIAAHILSTNGTMAVNIGKTDGTITVRTDPSYELGSIRGINSSISAHILSTGGTLGVSLKPGTIAVSLDPGYTLGNIGSITSITNSIAIHLLSTGGTLNVKLDPSSAGRHTDDTAFDVATDVGSPIMGLFDDTATDSVDEGDAGVMRMTGNRIQMVHSDGTQSIFTASGTASGVSVSGNTIISPSANYSFKVYAFSIQTTGIVSIATKFTNGAGTSPTEFWRPLITSSSSTSAPIGANLSTAGPGSPLFVTGTSTTLALVLDSATLVHYSVAYTKESA